MKFIIDIDGTICQKQTLEDYENSIPIQKRINKINILYEQGHQIIYFTARGMGRFNDNRELALQHFEQLTITQLNNWGCNYHRLLMGKPSGDIYIDDKGINDIEFFKEEESSEKNSI